MDDRSESGARAIAGRDQRDGLRSVRFAVSSAATTCAIAAVALRKGRPRAKIATNHQYPGLAAAATVSANPTAQLPRSVERRPKRSAMPATGRAPSDAKRITVKPKPNSVPERPACSEMEAPPVRCPKVLATSPSAATAPNCPNPAANAKQGRARHPRTQPSDQPNSRPSGSVVRHRHPTQSNRHAPHRASRGSYTDDGTTVHFPGGLELSVHGMKQTHDTQQHDDRTHHRGRSEQNTQLGDRDGSLDVRGGSVGWLISTALHATRSATSLFSAYVAACIDRVRVG